MIQQIIKDFPPNYEEVRKAFPAIKGRNILFSWGDKLYNPGGILVPRFIRVHEAAHGARQKGDVEGWWRRYIDDPDFLLEEELIAHSVEQEYRLKHAFNRRERRAILKQTAERLASRIYGPVVSKKKARKLLEIMHNA